MEWSFIYSDLFVKLLIAMFWMEQSLDPRAEAEVPTIAEKVFIVQKVSRETNKKSTEHARKQFYKRTN